jgi:hypothetical protein
VSELAKTESKFRTSAGATRTLPRRKVVLVVDKVDVPRQEIIMVLPLPTVMKESE